MAVPGAVSPWYRARLELARGMWLRRHRRVAQSRDALRAARKAFATLGAQAWAVRADRELAATGADTTADPGRDAGAGWTRLSPQELQIAQPAAAGLSNRAIGQRLYLSHRTVGSHLYRIYPKLGITSRANCTARCPTCRAETGGPGLPHSVPAFSGARPAGRPPAVTTPTVLPAER